ncbi:MAG: ATP-binding protein, partial [Verrucomicrobiales bacterium]|nr:ATP-binding protein [Verrucomicrobiales bacterium]
VQLQQAFLNLLLNALEAMSAQGALTVATRLEAPGAGSASGRLKATRAASRKPAFLCVSIADTGVGIAPEHLERVFDPFFTTKPGGTGLGLAMARRIAQEHGGDITVESELNRGATFHVRLPLAARR